MPRLELTMFGGGNWNDPPESLLNRSHQEDGAGGFVQRAPVEASSAQDVTFFERSMGTRLGSALLKDLGTNGANVLVSGEVLLDGTEFNGAAIVVGQKSIYTNQSGSWAQLLASDSTTFTWAADGGGASVAGADITKCSFAKMDGHLFIGADGANKIQVWKAGADLDAPMANGNTYEQIYGSNSTITGTWGTAYYIVRDFHGRLLFSTGNVVVEYTDVNQPWDRTGGGIIWGRDNVVALESFTPRGGNELTEVLFLFTRAGVDKLTGFSAMDSTEQGVGIGVPLNHRAVVKTEDWLIFLSREGKLVGINGLAVIDLGRRFLLGDGATGPLDVLSPSNSNHALLTFGFYDEKRRQALWFYPNESSTVVNRAIGLDFQLGEPYPGEQRESFERHVRTLFWTIYPTTTPWFVGMWQTTGAVYGLTANGNVWTQGSGRLDLDQYAIQDAWVTPELAMSQPTRNKSYRRAAVRADVAGSWNLYMDVAINKDDAWVKTFSIPLLPSGAAAFGTAVYGTDQYVTDRLTKWADYLDRYAESLRLRFRSQETSRYWVLRSITIDYQFGHESD